MAPLLSLHPLPLGAGKGQGAQGQNTAHRPRPEQLLLAGLGQMLQRPHHQLPRLANGLRDGAVDLAHVGEHQRRHRRRQQRAPGTAPLGQHHIDVELGEQHRDRLLLIHDAGRDLPQPADRPLVQVEIKGFLRPYQPQIVGEEGPEPIRREPLWPQVQHHLPPEALLTP